MTYAGSIPDTPIPPLMKGKIMRTIPGLNQNRVVRAFRRLGFEIVRESGHIIMKDSVGRIASIPRKTMIRSTTMKTILNQAGIDRELFLRSL